MGFLMVRPRVRSIPSVGIYDIQMGASCVTSNRQATLLMKPVAQNA